MVKKHELSRDLRQKIIKFHQDGLSVRKIGIRLDLAWSTVQYIIRKYKKSGLVVNADGRGRKRKTTATTDRYIKQLAMKDRKMSAVKIAAEVQKATSVEISDQTIRNRLHEANLHGRVARRKPLISEKNRRKRLAFAKKYVNKPNEFWNSVLWSDESKFNLFASDGRTKVWRTPDEAYRLQCLSPTVKHGGGNVMVWGCMAGCGVGNLHFIEGIMNAEMYEGILSTSMIPAAAKLLGRSYIFQHDNDPKHTAKRVTAFLKKKRVKVLDWPPQSPDLNPIEHLWEEMERQRASEVPRNKEQLKGLLQKTWNGLNQDICAQLVESLPRRLQAVIEAKGGPTKY